MYVTAIIAAAGAGRRLGAGTPKQLLELGGRTILEHSVEAFASHPRVQEVIVAMSAELARTPPAWLRGRPRVRVVSGGERRQDSVANAFDAIDEQTDLVLVHDAARPFVTHELISRSIDAAAEHGAAIVAQPVRDTVKRVTADAGSEKPSRSGGRVSRRQTRRRSPSRPATSSTSSRERSRT
jgi:2-C-methyl-D-erythritol 4-phosphate cytidylyltransferase